MKLRDKRTGREFDAPSEVGAGLVAGGLCEEIKQPNSNKAPTPKFEVRWSAQLGHFTQDYENPPSLNYVCDCGFKGYAIRVADARTLVVRHCCEGLAAKSTPPAEVAAQYHALHSQWAAKSRRRAKPAISAASPEEHIRKAGLKTSSELKMDLQHEIERAAQRKA